MSNRVNMADVAREAGVSMMTVSRVVNDKEGISEPTRQKVREVIDRLGYSPSSIARSLATNRTLTIGLVVPDNSNPFFSDVARGVEQVAYDNNYNVFLCNTHEDAQREVEVIESLVQHRVDGLILCSSRLDESILRSAIEPHQHVMLFNRNIDQVDDHVGLILLDSHQGGYSATQHLIDCGYKHIACLMGPSRSQGGERRSRGYIDALTENGFSIHPALQTHCAPTIKGGYEGMRQLLEINPDLDAVFCYNDLVAIGAIQACREMDKCVPQDVGIVGFDDIWMASLVTPALTTCVVPRAHIGEFLTTTLLDRIRDEANDTDPITISPELIIRESTP